MKSPILTAFALLALSHFTLADSGWMTDYDKALEKSKTEKKLVLLDFTGSDWCGWCMKLDKEVFSKPKFKQYAKDHFILVEVDFPQGKRLSKKLKEQNEQLQSQFAVRGYPTIIVVNSDGKKVGQLGYMEGGPDVFIAELEKLPKN